MKKENFARFLTALFFAYFGRMVGTAQNIEVLDAYSFEPVRHASLWTKENGKFHSAITDEHGKAKINFKFKELNITHINYEKQKLKYTDLYSAQTNSQSSQDDASKDNVDKPKAASAQKTISTKASSITYRILLTPKYYQAAEITVKSQEPIWIRKKLKEFIKRKKRIYHNVIQSLKYDYTTQSIAGNSYYKFDSQGVMEQINPEKSLYEIYQRRGCITSMDTTRLTDLTNLRRILYEDFVYCMDNEFISSHRFYVNEDFKGNPGEVELAFRSKKDFKDKGRFVIDTARYYIIRCNRSMDTKANKKEKVSSVMLSIAKVISGYKILNWETEQRTVYAQTDGSWHIAESDYKFFMKTYETSADTAEANFDRETGAGFSNMEATLKIGKPEKLTPQEELDTVAWRRLPHPWYLKYNSDADRANEIKLSHLPARLTIEN